MVDPGSTSHVPRHSAAPFTGFEVSETSQWDLRLEIFGAKNHPGWETFSELIRSLFGIMLRLPTFFGFLMTLRFRWLGVKTTLSLTAIPPRCHQATWSGTELWPLQVCPPTNSYLTSLDSDFETLVNLVNPIFAWLLRGQDPRKTSSYPHLTVDFHMGPHITIFAGEILDKNWNFQPK